MYYFLWIVAVFFYTYLLGKQGNSLQYTLFKYFLPLFYVFIVISVIWQYSFWMMQMCDLHYFIFVKVEKEFLRIIYCVTNVIALIVHVLAECEIDVSYMNCFSLLSPWTCNDFFKIIF